MYIKKGDKVQVLSGKDRGKQGVILRALPAENKVVVEGVSVVKKAVKPNAANQQGGIVSQEAPIDASNVNLVCPECGKVTRVGHEKDGKNKLRVCKKCGQVLSCPQHQVASKGPDAPRHPGLFLSPLIGDTHWGQTYMSDCAHWGQT